MAQYRAERLAHEIQRLLSELIQSELRDPRLRVATITRVEVSHDLRHAKVFMQYARRGRPHTGACRI